MYISSTRMVVKKKIIFSLFPTLSRAVISFVGKTKGIKGNFQSESIC